MFDDMLSFLDQVGNERYSMRVSLPLDNNGLLGRECPNKECHPRYFKGRPEASPIEEKDQSNFYWR